VSAHREPTPVIVSKRRDLRYQTAADIRADLKRLKRTSDSAALAAAPPTVRRGPFGDRNSVCPIPIPASCKHSRTGPPYFRIGQAQACSDAAKPRRRDDRFPREVPRSE
jgi:hypothetical protein